MVNVIVQKSDKLEKLLKGLGFGFKGLVEFGGEGGEEVGKGGGVEVGEEGF